MNESSWREGLFENFSEMVEINICETPTLVPDKNKLLRCFQYIKTDTVSVGPYCWNGDCINCQVWYKSEDGEIKSALACRMYVREGMVITDLSQNLKLDLSD